MALMSWLRLKDIAVTDFDGFLNEGEGKISMKVHWGRVFFVTCLLILIAGFLWLRQNAGAVHGSWRSLEYELSHLSGMDALRICFYLALGLGILWLLSRIVRWFRK